MYVYTTLDEGHDSNVSYCIPVVSSGNLNSVLYLSLSTPYDWESNPELVRKTYLLIGLCTNL